MDSRAKQLLNLALKTQNRDNQDINTAVDTSKSEMQTTITIEETQNNNFTDIDTTCNPTYSSARPSTISHQVSFSDLLARPSTSGTQKNVDETTTSDFSSDDSVADPTYSVSPSVLAQVLPQQHTRITDFSSDDSNKTLTDPTNSPNPVQPVQDEELPEQPSIHSRKRKRENKRQRNLGLSYVTASGKTIPERTLQELPTCRNKCKEKITNEERAVIHKEFWSIGSYDLRSAFVSSLITIQEKQTERRRVEDPDRQKFRQCTYTYHLDINGKKIITCQGCFLKTLSVTNNFVKLIGLKKRSSSSGIIQLDKRGKKSPRNKHSNEKIQEVINHINSFPLYESHYTRRRSTRKYLPSHLTISIMYSLYSTCHENPVSDKIYRREFHKLNLSFKKPKVDTCHTCDVFKMKISLCNDETEKNTLETERESHLLSADMAYNEKKVDKITASTDKTIKCLSFDLQQCLPTPALESSVAFYKRQLWTFNLTVHDNASGSSTHYMWHEGISGRGANQVASCLFIHLKELPEDVSEVILYSDTCGGQNKNTHVAAMFTYLMTLKPSIKQIHHKFMIPGHTHMEVDLDHAIIEKKKKKSAIQVYHPHDWMQLVRSSSKKFTVHEMKQVDFLNFANLLKEPLIARKKDTEGNVFKWHDVKWLCYEGDFGAIKFKTSLSRDSEFKIINFKRNTRTGNSGNIQLFPITTNLVPISVEKKKDLISLLPLVPECFHHFYKNLVTAADVADADPDLEESDDSA